MDATAGHSGFAVPVRRCNPSAIMMAMRVRLILILAASAALVSLIPLHQPSLPEIAW